MFEFTWARLGIFFAILFGMPLLAFGISALIDFIEYHEELHPWAAGGCVFILFVGIAALTAFIK